MWSGFAHTNGNGDGHGCSVGNAHSNGDGDWCSVHPDTQTSPNAAAASID